MCAAHMQKIDTDMCLNTFVHQLQMLVQMLGHRNFACATAPLESSRPKGSNEYHLAYNAVLGVPENS